MLNKMCKFVLSMTAGLMFCGSATANSTQLLAQVTKMLSTPAALQVNFSQSKKISGFSSSVNSSGKVKIAQSRGLLWITEKPSTSILKVTSSGISELRGGNATFSISSTQEPKIKSIGTILTSVISGNFAPLQRYFSITGSASKNSWRLELSPIDSGVRQAITNISVSGARYVNSVDIRENNGDKTHIKFNSPVLLSASEVGL